MLSALVKTISAVLIAACIVSVIGVTYAVIQDQSLNVNASITSWNEKTSTINLQVTITNKMTDDLKIIKITYNGYADRARNHLVCSGTIGTFTIHVSQSVTKNFAVQLSNLDQTHALLYVDAKIDYQLGNNPVAHQTISKTFNLMAIKGSGALP